MPVITYDKQPYRCEAGETVLQCLRRHGVTIPSSCESGVCQTCLMRGIQGRPPVDAQQGLRDTLRAQRYFLACICKPGEDMEVVPEGAGVTHLLEAEVKAKEWLGTDILRVLLRPLRPFEYKPGQFINLFRPDGLARSYSLASLPQDDECLELHVRVLADGNMGTWMRDEMRPGDRLAFEGPVGDCFYVPGRPGQDILLVGTGTGLAPLWGILRDALAHGHHGRLHLFHGSRTADGLYRMDELRALERTHGNFTYTPCVDAGDTADASGITLNRADLAALEAIPALAGWRIFLCGHPEMVSVMKKRAFLAGASLNDIYADPFVHSTAGHAGSRDSGGG
ncbi:MAG TPA: 2Fe-2S iron-sulfur cluster binding domain-containing protein [Chromatiales bacterium]|nr:2Fe-2S iron-sulfur cluster binding domain-containing protein [Chromatiales bacterium]